MQPGLFMFGHDEVGTDPQRLSEFVSIIKQMALFQPHIIIPDRILANSPNFRRALLDRKHAPGLYRLFSSGLVSYGAFQRHKSAVIEIYEGPLMTLCEYHELMMSSGRIKKSVKSDSRYANLNSSTLKQLRDIQMMMPTVGSSEVFRDRWLKENIKREIYGEYLKSIMEVDLHRQFIQISDNFIDELEEDLSVIHLSNDINNPDNLWFRMDRHLSDIAHKNKKLILQALDNVGHAYYYDSERFLSSSSLMLPPQYSGLAPVLFPSLRTGANNLQSSVIASLSLATELDFNKIFEFVSFKDIIYIRNNSTISEEYFILLKSVMETVASGQQVSDEVSIRLLESLKKYVVSIENIISRKYRPLVGLGTRKGIIFQIKRISRTLSEIPPELIPFVSSIVISVTNAFLQHAGVIQHGLDAAQPSINSVLDYIKDHKPVIEVARSLSSEYLSNNIKSQARLDLAQNQHGVKLPSAKLLISKRPDDKNQNHITIYRDN